MWLFAEKLNVAYERKQVELHHKVFLLKMIDALC